MARNRIIYASQSVWANGEVLSRVQSLGSTTSFTSEDIFEMGRLDIIDVVDDVPNVSVTLNTNDFGDVRTFATLAQVAPAKRAMDATAVDGTANLEVVTGANNTPTGTYLHGACLADFAIVCGNLPGVTLWAPVQDECSLGTLDNNIEQTLVLDELFVNSIEFSYSTGANATENYGAETDNKMWLLNDGRFVNYLSHTVTLGEAAAFAIALPQTDGAADVNVAKLSGGLGFIRKAPNGAPAVSVYRAATGTMENIEVAEVQNELGVAETFAYDVDAPTVLHLPTAATVPIAENDIIEIVYAADSYAAGASNDYMVALEGTDRPSTIGAVRQGQVEIYIVGDGDASFKNAWRVTGCTVSAELSREPLNELGHLGPYDRPLTMPIPINVNIETTAGDLENWAVFADKRSEFELGMSAPAADRLNDIDLADLTSSEDLKLVIKVFGQTDTEAGGTGSNRKIAAGSPFIGQDQYMDGVKSTAAENDTERALKTIVVEHLKITDEGATLDMGSNMTQSFGFRSTNDLYVVKGDISIGNITSGNKVRRNA